MSRPKVLLLVDDDADDHAIFIEAVQHVEKSSVCFSAYGGDEALHQLNTNTLLPDLIFLDINMPRMNGLEVLRLIKQAHHLKHIPVIIYSTTSDKDHVQQAKSLGAANFVIKPSKFSDLCILLQSMFSNFIF